MEQAEFEKAYAEQSVEHPRFVDYDAILNESVERNDTINNYVITMEECGELIQELSKHIRGEGNEYHLLEEMADVLICIDKVCRQNNIRSSSLFTAIEVKAMAIEREQK